ncbi:MAG: response regulator transcription factor, partial [Thermoleophilia bacterium]|nr:response regulator transcription factor [Thermoleophilia bacterium]
MAINAVADDQCYVDAPLVSGLLQLRGARQLTARERDVLTAMAKGLANRQIAAALAISVETVKVHVAAVLRKTGAMNRTAAVAMSLRTSMIG